MKLRRILETEEHELYPFQEYSYEIVFSHEEQISLRSVVTGTLKIDTLHVKEGDRLSVWYDINHRIKDNSVVYEIRLNKTRLLEDGEFSIGDPEDMNILEKDMQLKLDALRGVLGENNFEKVVQAYANLKRKINELQ